MILQHTPSARTRIGLSKIERNTLMPETWLARIKEDEEAEAEDVEDAEGVAVAAAVADEVVEEDQTFPHPNPKKIT